MRITPMLPFGQTQQASKANRLSSPNAISPSLLNQSDTFTAKVRFSADSPIPSPPPLELTQNAMLEHFIDNNKELHPDATRDEHTSLIAALHQMNATKQLIGAYTKAVKEKYDS